MYVRATSWWVILYIVSTYPTYLVQYAPRLACIDMEVAGRPHQNHCEMFDPCELCSHVRARINCRCFLGANIESQTHGDTLVARQRLSGTATPVIRIIRHYAHYPYPIPHYCQRRINAYYNIMEWHALVRPPGLQAPLYVYRLTKEGPIEATREPLDRHAGERLHWL
jgi:hypothetical protein